MSRYTPLKVLKNFQLIRPGGLGIRKVLITVQFTLSLVFIVSALIFYKQLDHYLHLEYGFSQENILNVELQGQSYEQVASQLAQVNTVEEISGCWFIPASGVSIGKNVKVKEEAEPVSLNYMAVTPNYFENHQIPLIAGRSFTLEKAKSELVINEKAVRALGFSSPQEAIGVTLLVTDGQESKEAYSAVITGVIRDFQDAMPIEEQHAMLLQYEPDKIKIANVRILPTDVRQTLTSLRESWEHIDKPHFLYDFSLLLYLQHKQQHQESLLCHFVKKYLLCSLLCPS